MLVLFGQILETKRVFVSLLVGHDSMKCSNKVRSEIVVIGANDRAERTASLVKHASKDSFVLQQHEFHVVCSTQPF